MFWNKYPYTDFHELNLDMILHMMHDLHNDWDEFKALNTITQDGLWDITKQYTTWTIVSYDGAGYLSIQPVPAGIDITNTDYWLVIDDYKTLVDDLEARLDTLSYKVDVNTSDIEDLQREVGGMTPNFIFISDSFGQPADAWFTHVVTNLQLDAAHYTASAVGGDAFCDSAGSNGFLTQLQNITVADPDEISDIVVLGGTNDIEIPHITDLWGNIVAFVNYAKTTFKNARVWIAFAGTKYRSADLSTGLTEYRSLAENYYKDACARSGAFYIGGCKEALSAVKDRLNSDHVHPNSEGSKVIGNIVTLAVRGNCNSETYTGRVLYEKGTSNNNVFSGSYQARCGEAMNQIILQRGYASASAITGGNYYTVMDFADLPAVPPYVMSQFIPVRISGVWYKFLCTLSATGIEIVAVNTGESVPSGTAVIPVDIIFTFPC